jgi:uncharacterized protein involved in propanediol utilization
LGSSTSDVFSTIRDVASAHGRLLPAEEVARIAVLAEGAADGIMFGHRAVLYANRDGTVLEDLGGPLPSLEVLGLDAGGPGVDTLELPAFDYSPDQIESLRVLRATMRRAVAGGDCALLAEVATASARINQRFLPQEGLPLVEAVCRDSGGVGVQAAHSGRVLAVLFDPAAPGLESRIDHARARLARNGVDRTWRFRLESPNPRGTTAPLCQECCEEPL